MGGFIDLMSGVTLVIFVKWRGFSNEVLPPKRPVFLPNIDKPIKVFGARMTTVVISSLIVIPLNGMSVCSRCCFIQIILVDEGTYSTKPALGRLRGLLGWVGAANWLPDEPQSSGGCRRWLHRHRHRHQ